MLNSIRTKLTLWYVGVLAAVVIAFSVTAYFMLVRAFDSDVDKRLVEMARNFGAAMNDEFEEESAEATDEKALTETVNELRFRDYQFVIVTSSGRVLASTAEFSADTDYPKSVAEYSNVTIDNRDYRVFQSPLVNHEDSYRLLVFHPLEEQNEWKNRVAAIFLFGVPFTLILAGVGGYFLARKSLLPMVEMGRQAAQISARNLSDRISIKNERDELGDLARVFNDMLERLDRSFDQQRRFMADASHELRTPLAIIRGESEVALSQDRRKPEEYKESLDIVHDESKRLTRIVEDLFTLARADAGQFGSAMAPVYLDEIAADAVRSIHVLAEAKDIRLFLMSVGEMPLAGDESLLGRLFLNLLDNAIKFTPSGGNIRVELRVADDRYQVIITDTGIGIPPADQQKIFDRFYRVDQSRSHSDEVETSGAGLGLSIASWIAGIHNGSVKLASSSENGSVFLVEFVRSD